MFDRKAVNFLYCLKFFIFHLFLSSMMRAVILSILECTIEAHCWSPPPPPPPQFNQNLEAIQRLKILGLVNRHLRQIN